MENAPFRLDDDPAQSW